ncbi:hypothetical protein [Marinobacter sp. CHS3-4]|uniref:hypothetical protein n=1 Tax=Marinobacter sp. CHS3-4 TaxID=3045174 RepID=UPI0024B4B79A|nr:hypothetical protein [Marinobacter sp. CHS3-4]MDI9244650.1 hypothetical protein [Marinobacter sp. CHS3-4]
MRYLMVLLVTVVFSGTALAGQCPSLVRDIDEKLKMADMDTETLEKIKKLRDQGQSLHGQGKHGESVKVLKQAMEELESMSELEGEA